jgi:aryl-alcohol dehydrogenase-like predicted oxidoreductase
VARDIEPEYVPMARTLGMGITGFGPLAGGLLTGKYRRSEKGVEGEGRLGNEAAMARPLSDHDWQVVAVLEEVAAELDRPMAQVAVNWAATQPGIAAVIVGASSVRQLESSLAALTFEIPADARRTLDEVSRVRPPLPHWMFTPEYQSYVVSPGLGIGDKPAGYAPPVWNGPVAAG